jgi:hypothetical protein
MYPMQYNLGKNFVKHRRPHYTASYLKEVIKLFAICKIRTCTILEMIQTCPARAILDARDLLLDG